MFDQCDEDLDSCYKRCNIGITECKDDFHKKLLSTTESLGLISGNECVQTEQCIPNEFIPNCVNFDDFGNCIGCSGGFVLEENSC